MRKLLFLYLLFFSVQVFAERDTIDIRISPQELAAFPLISNTLEEAYSFYDEGAMDEALSRFQGVLIQLVPDFNEINTDVNPDEKHLFANSLLVKALEGKARVYEQKGSEANFIEKALACRELMIEANRHLLHTGSVYRKEHYDQLIDLAYSLYVKTNDPSVLFRVFRLVEKCRKVRTLENLRDPATGHIANVPSELFERQQDEKLQLDQKLRAYMAVKGSDKGADAETVYKAARKKYQNGLFDIKKDYPDFYRLMYDESVVTIGEIQNRLSGKDEALLTYYETADYLYAFVIALNGYRATKIKKDFDLVKMVRDLKTQINKSTPEDCDAYKTLAHDLYQKVLRPVGVLPLKLVIVPDGALAQIPFSALLSEKPDNCNFRSFPYLLWDHQISYHYGPDLFAKAAYREHKDYDGFVGFGSKAALEPIKKLMSGKIFDVDLMEAMEFKQEVADASLLHLAIPTKTNATEKEQFYISLPGGIRLADKAIYDLGVDAQLAVLEHNAIGTSNDRLLQIVHGLQYAGTQSVLASMWNTDAPQVRQKMMLDFYTQLRNGERKDKALRSACLAIWNDKKARAYVHPKHWSALVPIGDMDEIKKQNWYLYLIGVTPLLALLYFWRKYTIKRRKAA